jgi:hypothetical protein
LRKEHKKNKPNEMSGVIDQKARNEEATEKHNHTSSLLITSLCLLYAHARSAASFPFGMPVSVFKISMHTALWEAGRLPTPSLP